MTDLIEQLAALTGPDREMDAAIARVANWQPTKEHMLRPSKNDSKPYI